MDKLEKKIKDLKEFIKEKTDQGTANYLGKEIREICGIVESKQFSLQVVKPQLVLFADWLQYNGKYSLPKQQAKDFLKEQQEQN